jgi:hypothetical protein
MASKKTSSDRLKDTMRPQYDMRRGERGRYAKRFQGDVKMIALEADVAAAFPDAESVNAALRVILRAATQARASHERSDD